MPQSPINLIRQWKLPFRTERDVTDGFSADSDKLLSLIQGLEPPLTRQIEQLKYAREKYELWVAQPAEGTNMFIAPTIDAAIEGARALLNNGRVEDSFWVSNVFGEMCKILVSRRRDKYQNLFEDLLSLACYAVSDSWHANNNDQVEASGVGEISKLSTHLNNIINQNALGYYFNLRTNEFMRGRADVALSECVINNALARHFDKRLRHLLQNNRPRVKEYATTNMPLVYRLELPKEWAAEKRKQWKRVLIDAGYDDVIRLLEDMGDLLNPDEVGQVNSERREDVMRAATSNDLDRVSGLL